MAIIENFSELTKQELEQFAADIVKKINDQKIFTKEVDLVLDTDNFHDPIDPDKLTGNLYIYLKTKDDESINIARGATWTASEDDLTDMNDAEFETDIVGGIIGALNCTEAEVDGYKLTLTVDDGDADLTDVEVDSHHIEHGGIGHYEYWGYHGYDDYEYCEVEGTVYEAAWGFFTLTIEPIVK